MDIQILERGRSLSLDQAIISLPQIPPSPIPASLAFCSNERLPDIIAGNTWTTIRKVKDDLACLDGVEAQLEVALTSILSIRDQLQKRRAALVEFQVNAQARCALPSIAHDLIPEVLSNIFLCHQQYLHTQLTPQAGIPEAKQDSFSTTHGPLPLTWVCRRWRDVALSTSQIWTTLKLVDKTYYSKPLFRNSKSHLLGLWLERSLNLPIKLQLVEHPLINAYKDTSHYSGFPRDTTESILQCFPRCKSIHIFGSFRKPAHLQMYFPSPGSNDLPLLEELRVINYSKNVQEDTGEVLKALNAPLLNRIEFNRLGLLRLVHLPAPRHKLKHLRLDVQDEQITFHQILDLVSSHPSLEVLDVSCVYYSYLSQLSFEPRVVQHEMLHALTLRFNSPREPLTASDLAPIEGLGNLFSALQLPELETLDISCNYEQPWDDSSFHSFLENCPSLQNITVQVLSPISSIQLLRYLAIAPQLRSVRFDIPDTQGDDLITAFSAIGPPLLPSRVPSLYLLRAPTSWVATVTSSTPMFLDMPWVSILSP